ncbi:MAG: type II toxin-antitoxin system RelE/ParE family toxin [Clostridiales bacterium]|nr:type II toxin-antitoxin system RelE/ParE family toxin [Clostridiales bacterium]
MNRTFIEVPTFSVKWQSLGLTDEDLRVLQGMLLKNPKSGLVIPETGGLRKVRIPVGTVGKRSGGRVIYVDIEVKECIYLLDVYAKNEKLDLTTSEKKLLRKLVKVLKEE